jgi:hypothetical protein
LELFAFAEVCKVVFLKDKFKACFDELFDFLLVSSDFGGELVGVGSFAEDCVFYVDILLGIVDALVS